MLSLRKTIAVGAALAGAMLVPAVANAQAMTAYTTADLNLRGGPGTEYQIILAMPQWSPVTVNYCSNSTSWCNVSYYNATGWASARYLTTEPPRYAQAPQQPNYQPQQPNYQPQQPNYQPQPAAPVYQPAPPPPPPQYQPPAPVYQPAPNYYYGYYWPFSLRFNFWFH